MSPIAIAVDAGDDRAACNGHATAPLARGVYVPTVVLFTKDENLDLDAIERHATRLASTGIAGIVTHGSNGEAVHLSAKERAQVTDRTRRALDAAGYSDMPLIVGCGAPSTRETIQLCVEAKPAGGSHALVLAPSYYKALVSPKQLLDHFRRVADASPVPVLIYNYPGAACGLDLDSDQILELSQHPNIVGCKLTCGDTGKLARVAASAKAGFRTFGGSADFILPTLIMQGHGVIAGLANIAPRACVEVVRLYEAGRVKEAQGLQAVVARGDWVAIKGGFVAVKTALKLFGRDKDFPDADVMRSPCSGPDEAASKGFAEGFAELVSAEATLC